MVQVIVSTGLASQELGEVHVHLVFFEVVWWIRNILGWLPLCSPCYRSVILMSSVYSAYADTIFETHQSLFVGALSASSTSHTESRLKPGPKPFGRWLWTPQKALKAGTRDWPFDKAWVYPLRVVNSHVSPAGTGPGCLLLASAFNTNYPPWLHLAIISPFGCAPWLLRQRLYGIWKFRRGSKGESKPHHTLLEAFEW